MQLNFYYILLFLLNDSLFKQEVMQLSAQLRNKYKTKK